jgi:flagellar motor switch protein FliG
MKAVNSINEISRLDDCDVRTIVDKLEMDDLVIALKGVSSSVVRKIYAGMSAGAVEEAKKRSMEMGPVKADTIEKVHAKIVVIANGLTGGKV